MKNTSLILANAGFTDDFQKKSTQEGWRFIEQGSKDCGNQELVLDKVPGQYKLRNVDEVYEHVIKESDNGSEIHTLALEILKKESPFEYSFRMARYKELLAA